MSVTPSISRSYPKKTPYLQLPVKLRTLRNKPDVCKFVNGTPLQIDANLPESSTWFVGRSAEVTKLQQCLLDEASPVVVLSGPGGIGKTQLALGYVRRHRSEFDNILWFNATSLDKLGADFRAAASKIVESCMEKCPDDPPPPNEWIEYLGLKFTLQSTQMDELRQSMLDEIALPVLKMLNGVMGTRNGRSLLVFDGYDDPKTIELKSYLGPSQTLRVIITSRKRSVGAMGRVIPIRSLLADDNAELLLKSAQEWEPQTAQTGQLLPLLIHTSHTPSLSVSVVLTSYR
jgi:hypothetical protein